MSALHFLALLPGPLIAPSEEAIPLNLSVDVVDYVVAGPLVATLVRERGNDFADLNGDGDADDLVVHVFDADQGSLINLAVAGTNPVGLGSPTSRLLESDGRLVTFPVSERDQGLTDLNGDGDIEDHVLFVYDHVAETLVSLQVGIVTERPAAVVGSKVFCLVDEASEGSDLNGDGDTLDAVAHVYDVAADRLDNLGLALISGFTPFNAVAFDAFGDTLALTVSEAAAGAQDLNGDGDSDDLVLFVHDAGDGLTLNLALALRFGALFSGELLPIAVPEASQGSDLNGDGDLEENVLHVFDPVTREVANTGLASIYFQLGPFDRFGALGVDERSQGETDLNGDGDLHDFVLYLFDRQDGSVRNLKLSAFLPRFVSTGRSPRLARPGSASKAPEDQLLMVDALEGNLLGEGVRNFFPGQDADLNGDGDQGDIVLTYVDLREQRIVSTGLASADSSGFFLGDPTSANFAAVRLDEAGQRTDANGDGDMNDFVVQIFDTRTREFTNTSLSVFCCDGNVLGSFMEAHRNVVLIPVDESAQGDGDLNGDGDLFDDVLHTYDTRTGQAFNHELSAERLSMRRDGGLFAFLVFESSQDADLNADGDEFDRVLHVLDLR